MTRSIIYTVSDGKLTAMTPAAPESEDVMQQLVADYPSIIADGDGELLLIKREQAIGDGTADARWSLDHLFVTREGVPVLVELKRAVDTRLRREVVGQMLDYAANSTAHWKAGTIAAGFTATAEQAGLDAAELLTTFLGEDADPEAFWEQVDANFSAGRIKLVFVADRIPRELARIVEFLNEQMKADVRAVELNWFEGQGVKAFTPRIIGETERAQAIKSSGRPLPSITRDEWIEQNIVPLGAASIAAANRFVDLIDFAGGHAEVTGRHSGVVAVFDLRRIVYPLMMERKRKGAQVALQLSFLKAHHPFNEDIARREIYDGVSDLVGPLSTDSISGFPAFPLECLNDPAIFDGLLAILKSVVERLPPR